MPSEWEKSMDKRIAKLSRGPFFVSLVDRAISMYIDEDSGDLFIDEGAGAGRMNGAGLYADQGTRFVVEPTESGCILKLVCGTFVWEAGWTDNAEDAANWVDAVNRFLETKRGAAATNGKPIPPTPNKQVR
jgi:hypothetical protein